LVDEAGRARPAIADVRGPMVDKSELALEAIFSRLRQHHQRLDLLTRNPKEEGRAAAHTPLEEDSPMTAVADAVLATEAPPPGRGDPDPAASAAHAT
jgi:hypothetical protein